MSFSRINNPIYQTYRQPVIAFLGDSVTHGCFGLYVENDIIRTYMELEKGYFIILPFHVNKYGELPNIKYDEAYIECGEDYILVGGNLYFNESFNRNYIFSPECKLYKNDTVIKISEGIENKRCTPMEYMNELEEVPQIHNTIDKNQLYDPEICMFINYKGDENNRAYTLQKN